MNRIRVKIKPTFNILFPLTFEHQSGKRRSFGQTINAQLFDMRTETVALQRHPIFGHRNAINIVTLHCRHGSIPSFRVQQPRTVDTHVRSSPVVFSRVLTLDWTTTARQRHHSHVDSTVAVLTFCCSQTGGILGTCCPANCVPAHLRQRPIVNVISASAAD